MCPVREQDKSSTSFPAVVAPQANNASSITNQLGRAKPLFNPDLKRTRPLNQQVVKIPPQEDHRRPVGGHYNRFIAGGDKSHPVDWVCLRAQLATNAKGLS